jgi:predicted helicase
MNTEKIKSIKDFKSLAHFLAEELSWPIDPENVDVDDLVFEYQPDDIGLSDEFAAKVQSIKQIRPLDTNQPWSIFWVDFENKKLPLTVLRRILNVFVTKKRGNSKNIATKDMEDIMFVSGHGENRNRAITFAHFKKLDDSETIREFYWDGHETKFDHISSYLEKLEWPTNTTDTEGWRKKWKAAFTGSTREAITTSDQLARAMANIARNIRDRVLEVLEVEHANGPVHKLYDTFRKGLVHDMTEQGFADMYAQTITYGLFSARTMDTDGQFELHEVIDLIPSTNPFLKNLFKECLNTADKKHKIDLDELGVGRLVDLFDNLNRSDGTDAMQRILAEFGRQTFSGQEDPVIHFYEGFLKEYDSLQRIEKGVYYTPDPVVKFIVRSVNEQLKSEFGLEYGLADTTTWGEMVASGRAEYPVDPNTRKVNKEWIDKIKGRAFVQILDPATGTGTFLKHVIDVIHEEVKIKFKKEQINGSWEDYWNSYVYNGLLPRIYGFELMMASYSVAHMKLGMFLKSTGYKFEKEQRLNIYLTNSLEPFTAGNETNLFFNSVGVESSGASDVKKNRYFSVVIGNPPYSGISNNKDPWITNLIEDYKYVDGVHFNERKHWLNDDYVKFIRLGEFLISKNGAGVLGYINPHGFLDNPTFRGMRWQLLNSFDSIKVIDLHGNTKKKETALDGSQDVNVFDIQQGVSINLLIKKSTSTRNKLGVVNSFDLLGKREYKYDFLLNTTINKIDFKKISYNKPNYFFVTKNEDGREAYENGFKINELFPTSSVGFVSANDELNISFTENEQQRKIQDIINMDEETWRNIYKRPKDADSWKLMWAKDDARNNINKELHKVAYRPFDIRYSLYTGKSGGLYARPVFQIMQQFLSGENLGLLAIRRSRKKDEWTEIFCSNKIVSGSSAISSLDINYIFPLYLYPTNKNSDLLHGNPEKTPNLNKEILRIFELRLKSKFSIDFTPSVNSFTPINVFDFIYSILHSPKYRKKYNEFLKIDFPRVPYPNDLNTFWQLVNLGSELRQIHLLESSEIENFNTAFPVSGNNEVLKKIELKDNRVYINQAQYFDGIPEVAWNLYIGGYQPAQKWLKDRKGRILADEDVIHYQKIIVALTETDRIMKEIDKIDFLGENENQDISNYQSDDHVNYGIAAES